MTRIIAVITGGLLGFVVAIMVAQSPIIRNPSASLIDIADEQTYQRTRKSPATTQEFASDYTVAHDVIIEMNSGTSSATPAVRDTPLHTPKSLDQRLSKSWPGPTYSDDPQAALASKLDRRPQTIDRTSPLYRIQYELARLDCFDRAVDGQWSTHFHEQLARVATTEEIDLAGMASTNEIIAALREASTTVCNGNAAEGSSVKPTWMEINPSATRSERQAAIAAEMQKILSSAATEVQHVRTSHVEPRDLHPSRSTMTASASKPKATVFGVDIAVTLPAQKPRRHVMIVPDPTRSTSDTTATQVRIEPTSTTIPVAPNVTDTMTEQKTTTLSAPVAVPALAVHPIAVPTSASVPKPTTAAKPDAPVQVVALESHAIELPQSNTTSVEQAVSIPTPDINPIRNRVLQTVALPPQRNRAAQPTRIRRTSRPKRKVRSRPVKRATAVSKVTKKPVAKALSWKNNRRKIFPNR